MIRIVRQPLAATRDLMQGRPIMPARPLTVEEFNELYGRRRVERMKNGGPKDPPS